MILLSKNHFNQFCFDVINSPVHLTELVKNETEQGLMVIFCESSKYNSLLKEYPDKEELYKYIAKNKKDPGFHFCLYDKKSHILKVDSSVYKDITFE